MRVIALCTNVRVSPRIGQLVLLPAVYYRNAHPFNGDISSMRTAFIAGLLLLVGLALRLDTQSFSEFHAALSAGDWTARKDVLIATLGVLLLIEAMIQKVARRESNYDLEDQSVLRSQTMAKLEVASKTLETTRAELLAEQRRSTALDTALNDTRKRLEHLESQTGLALRPEVVTAELVHLLSLFQERGRLVDFLMEDIASYGDTQVGAVARVVHEGCSRVLKEYFAIEPVHIGSEGSEVTLESEFSPRRFRLIGKVHGTPPYHGVVLHRGWQTKGVTLPRVVATGHTSESEGIIAPTEVEVR